MKRIDKVEQALQQIWQNKSQEVLLNGALVREKLLIS